MAKAPAIDQHALLAVQALDSKVLQLAHKQRTLPELAELKALDERRAELQERLDEAAGQLSAANAALRESEEEVAALQARLDKNQARLDAGTGNVKDLTVLQTDIEHLRTRREDLETVELERMEQVESASEAADALTREMDGINVEAGELGSARDAATAALEEERRGVEAERAAAAAGIDPDLLSLYETLRARLGGVGAAALRRNACEACGQQFSSSELNIIAEKPDDEIVRCEECERILVRV